MLPATAKSQFFECRQCPIAARTNIGELGTSELRKARSKNPKAGQDVAQADQLTPEALGKFHRAEAERWWPIIKAAAIKAQ